MKMRWMVERMRKDNTGMKRGMEQLKGWNGIKKKKRKKRKNGELRVSGVQSLLPFFVTI